MRNLQEQVKKAFCYQKLFWPFTVWINCSSDLKIFDNSWPSASNFKSFSRSLEQFFLTVSQNNFGNKMSFFEQIFEWVLFLNFLHSNWKYGVLYCSGYINTIIVFKALWLSISTKLLCWDFPFSTAGSYNNRSSTTHYT